MKLQEYFLCAKKTKMITLFNNFFSSVSVFECMFMRVLDAYVVGTLVDTRSMTGNKTHVIKIQL